MLSISMRRAALAGLALAISNAAVAAPIIGHFEAQNARWAKAPGFAGRGEALHYSPISHEATLGQSYMGTSFFPAAATQMNAIEQLQIDFFLPVGQTCAVGKLEATIVLTDTSGADRFIYGTLPTGKACQVGAWKTANFMTDANWSYGSLANAHAAALADPTLGANYQIRIIRVSYTAGTNTEAWFDLQKINSVPFAERIEDLSTNALMPEQQLGNLPTALGYFQTKNLRWGKSPLGLPHGEAMHYSPWSHEAGADAYGATSFFPQTALTLRDVYALGFSMLIPAGSSCQVGQAQSPYFWFVLSNQSGTQTVDAFAYRTDMTSLCSKTGTWQKIDFVNSANVKWDLYYTVNGSAQIRQGLSKDEAHSIVVNDVLKIGYKTTVVRTNFSGGPEAWFDQEMINGLQLLERAQDWSQNALLPDVSQIPDGTVPELIP